MNHKLLLSLSWLLLLATAIAAQTPANVHLSILKAEDARRYDAVLEGLMRSPNADIRTRAALAAGRIGNESALPVLAEMLASDASIPVRAMAAFAIGEIESINGADAILAAMKEPQSSYRIVARAVEAAGKIAAANAKDERAKALGQSVIDCLNTQATLKLMRDSEVTRLALTAALRARPAGADAAVAKFLTDIDARIRTDAANAMTRLRARNANETLRKMVKSDNEPAARANAARALGAAEDRDAFGVLIDASSNDPDSRVRVSAIRALIGLKDPKAANRLLERGNDLLILANSSKFRRPVELNELLEIATALGRSQPNTENEKTVAFLNDLRKKDGYSSSETEIAFARVAPRAYLADGFPVSIGYKDPHAAAAYAQGLAEIAATKDANLNAMAGEKLTAFISSMATSVRPADQKKMLLAMPDVTTAMAALKPDNLDELLRGQLANADVFIRAAAAAAMADRPVTDDNIEALKKAYLHSTIIDKANDDALIAILDALFKLDKNRGFSTALVALYSQNFVVRKKAFELLSDKDLQAKHPGIPLTLEIARNKRQGEVQPYNPVYRTKLGQVLNTDLDYRRALSRKNGSVSAVLATEKGTFTIVFNPEEAPLTVDNFVKLARSGYFNGLEVHRVVPNFVMQDGDPRGDGNGGPGWTIRCEVNMLPYDRGAVGMALSGKDTGGSQWFVTHSPQPHLDGGYTVFGHVNETDMKVVDNIVRGDKIISVQIIGR